MTSRVLPILIDPATLPLPVTGPLTDAQLRAAPVVIDSGAKVTAAPALGVGGAGLIGWLSQIWSALTGTLAVSGPLTDTQLRAAAVPVTAGQITSVSTTISSGASVSADIDLGMARLGRIAMPASWTAANLTFQVSFDGATWNNLYDKDGTEYTVTAAASRSNIMPLADMLSVRYLRIRSGTSATPVTQAAARTITLVLVP